MASPTVVLGVSGSIAAYKSAALARLLVKAGVRVLPVMTRAAQEMIGAATLAGITGESVRCEMFAPTRSGEEHVELGRADLVAVAPATADFISALAAGRADDLLRATTLCAQGPLLLAPAMHPRMWAHKATARNVAQVVADGAVLVGPVEGEVASGEVGVGRMAEPEAIAEAILARLSVAGPPKSDLAGRRVVVSAGPTIEAVDPARYLSNRSSGKMGYAIAARAAARGAEVCLVSGPVALPAPDGVRVVPVKSALEMKRALWRALGSDLAGADALIMAAAVADYRPARVYDRKLKSGHDKTLRLVPNPDLLAGIGWSRPLPKKRRGQRPQPKPVLVGFALESADGEELIALARKKLRAKRVDLIAANCAADAFEGDESRLWLVTADGVQDLPRAEKTLLADQLLDRVKVLMAAP